MLSKSILALRYVRDWITVVHTVMYYPTALATHRRYTEVACTLKTSFQELLVTYNAMQLDACQQPR